MDYRLGLRLDKIDLINWNKKKKISQELKYVKNQIFLLEKLEKMCTQKFMEQADQPLNAIKCQIGG